jgi:hypothetical protein
MREICTSGSVGGPGSDPRVYPTLSCNDCLRPKQVGRITLHGHNQREGFRLIGAETPIA